MQPVMQYVGEKQVEELTPHVYYKAGTAESVLYDDGGKGYAYQQGQQTTHHFTVTSTATTPTVSQRTEGDYQPSYATYRVVLHGLLTAPLTAVVDGQPVALGGTYPATETTIAAAVLVVSVNLKELRIELELAPDKV
jgi:alpha-glucosidase